MDNDMKKLLEAILAELKKLNMKPHSNPIEDMTQRGILVQILEELKKQKS